MKGNLNDGVSHKEKSLRLMGYIVRLHPGNMSIRAETWGVGGGRAEPFNFDHNNCFPHHSQKEEKTVNWVKQTLEMTTFQTKNLPQKGELRSVG